MKSREIKITGIGGMPFTDHLQAWEWALKFDLAFRPELPTHFPDESLIGQLQHWPNNPFPPIPDFIGNKLKMRKVALHYPGPDVREFLSTTMTLGDYFQSLLERWQQDKAEIMRWQGLPIMFLDMPNWSQWELHRAQEIIFWQQLKRDVIGEWGIHCCGRFEIESVKKASPDFLSFDYMNMMKASPAQSEELLALAEKMNLIFGVIDSGGGFMGSDQILALSNQLVAGKVLWLSPTCGLSGAKSEVISDIYSTLSQWR